MPSASGLRSGRRKKTLTRLALSLHRVPLRVRCTSRSAGMVTLSSASLASASSSPSTASSRRGLWRRSGWWARVQVVMKPRTVLFVAVGITTEAARIVDEIALSRLVSTGADVARLVPVDLVADPRKRLRLQQLTLPRPLMAIVLEVVISRNFAKDAMSHDVSVVNLIRTGLNAALSSPSGAARLAASGRRLTCYVAMIFWGPRGSTTFLSPSGTTGGLPAGVPSPALPTVQTGGSGNNGFPELVLLLLTLLPQLGNEHGPSHVVARGRSVVFKLGQELRDAFAEDVSASDPDVIDLVGELHVLGRRTGLGDAVVIVLQGVAKIVQFFE